VKSHSKEELVDITSEVERVVAKASIEEGICHLFALHTTAGLLINENADPSVKADILMTLSRIVPDSLPYTHAEGNSPAHVKSSLVGHCLTIPVSAGKLVLGTWQGIFLAEFDGPRTRNVHVSIHSSS